MNGIRHFTLMLGLAALVAATSSCTRVPPGTYATPEEAVKDLGDLAGTGDMARAEIMFGHGASEILKSGDDVADREDALKVKSLIAEKVAFEDAEGGGKVALLGNDAWPFPVPLKLDKDRWRFDIEAGKEEILNRRIGRNELEALASLRAYVDAQAEYMSQGRDGKPPAYARRFLSTEGQHDGLYWPVAEGEEPSPLGPLLAEASVTPAPGAEGPRPFNGYYFRILESQGPGAPGGTRSYVDAAGLMTGGHAIIAWPATHGNSGVMTFITDRSGVVFQKDLGPTTETAVAVILSYEPTDTWSPTAD